MGGRAFLRAIVTHFMGCDEPEGPSPDGPEPAIEMNVHHRPVRTQAPRIEISICDLISWDAVNRRARLLTGRNPQSK
jgi:hypothetical protein